MRLKKCWGGGFDNGGMELWEKKQRSRREKPRRDKRVKERTGKSSSFVNLGLKRRCQVERREEEKIGLTL